MEARVIAHRIPQEDIYKQPLCNYIKVNCEAGDFTLFDSRTFHCGCPPRN
jgi:ectoine hydroxylase-related dioxygenase (phytanoyl-CoA dioxygenase family)